MWIAVGGTPQSVVRAGSLGLPMALAIIGGQPARFAPFAELHRRAAAEAGHERPALSINSHGFIADDTRTALDLAYPAHKVVMDKIGRERGWPPMTRAQFEAGATLQGHNVARLSPAEVIEKILFQHSIFDHDRFLLQLSVGTLPHDAVMRAIELYGTEVRARRARGSRAPPRAGGVRLRRRAAERGVARPVAPGTRELGSGALLYVPATEGPWPLVVLFHGAGSSARAGLGLLDASGAFSSPRNRPAPPGT